MTRPVVRCVAVIAALAGIVPIALAAARHRAPAFPDGYRRWTHVSSTFIGPDAPAAAMTERGVHHIYANDLAVDGMRSGRFPDGARLVYDLLETQTANGATKVTGTRLRLDVMEKDSARYGATGGWGFESFVNGDRARPRVNGQEATMCWQCHQQRTEKGVFSQYRE